MVKRDEEESVGRRGRVKRMERTVSEEGGKRKEEAQRERGWFQLGGSNSPGHCSFHSRFVFPVCLFPSHLR